MSGFPSPVREFRDVELLGQTYRCEKLTTPEAYHLGIRMLPFIQGLAPMMSGAPSDIETLMALTGTIGQMSLEDADFLRDVCLGNVRWRQGERWVPLRPAGGVRTVHDWADGAADRLDVQLRLMGEVLAITFFGFRLDVLLPSTPTNGLDSTEPLAVPAAA